MFKTVWRIIKSFFRKTPIVRTTPIPLPDMPRIGFVRGHEAKAQGAQSNGGLSEYDYWGKVLPEVVRRTVETKEFLRNGTNIRGAIRNALGWKPDIIIELHFNAYNKSVNGAEVLICDNSQRQIANDLLGAWLVFSNKSNRGVKMKSSGDAGYASVDEMRRGGVQGCLFEPFFGDNPNDYVEPEIMIEFLVEFVNEMQGV